MGKASRTKWERRLATRGPERFANLFRGKWAKRISPTLAAILGNKPSVKISPEPDPYHE